MNAGLVGLLEATSLRVTSFFFFFFFLFCNTLGRSDVNINDL